MTIPRFVKKTGRDFVIIPGVGRVVQGQVLAGFEYRRFETLGLLEEVLTPPPEVVVAPAPVSEKESEEVFPEPSEPPEEPDLPSVKSSGVLLPDMSELEEPDLRKPWERESLPDIETTEAKKARMEKRAAARRKGLIK